VAVYVLLSCTEPHGSGDSGLALVRRWYWELEDGPGVAELPQLGGAVQDKV
jgi:hypothetical protein